MHKRVLTLFWFLMTLDRMSEDSCSLDCGGTGVDSDLAGEGRGVEAALGAAVGTAGGAGLETDLAGGGRGGHLDLGAGEGGGGLLLRQGSECRS